MILAKTKFFTIQEHNGKEIILLNRFKAKGYVKKSVMIISLNQANEIVFVNKYFSAFKKFGLCLPGGIIDYKEKPEQAVKRELIEEADLDPQYIKHLTTLYILPGYLDAQTHVYLAQNLKPAQLPKDQTEIIKHLKNLKVEKVMSLIRNGKIQDARTIAAVLFFVSSLNLR